VSDSVGAWLSNSSRVSVGSSALANPKKKQGLEYEKEKKRDMEYDDPN